MTQADSYQTLEASLLSTRLEQLNTIYWDTLDYLANVVAERALVMNLIRDMPVQRSGE